MRRRLAAPLVVACVLAVLFALAGMGSASADTTSTTVPAPEQAHPGVRRVLVISLPTISWEDLDLAKLPNMRKLFEQSAMADLIVRGVFRLPTLADEYLTIGAGARSVGVSRIDSPCLEMNEPFGGGTAREEMARRDAVTADTLPASGIGCFAMPQIDAKNDKMLYDAQEGLLGGTLAAAGVSRAAIGNGDTTLTPVQSPPGATDYRRYAPLALADANGLVPDGAVSSSLLMRDPSAPFGIRMSPSRTLAAFDQAWGNVDDTSRHVVLVEASDILRMREYQPLLSASGRSAMQAKVLQQTDDMVGALLSRVDPKHDAVLVVAPSQKRGPGRLTAVALRAPGVRPGLAESDWTRHTGLVHIVDIGPTILDQLGLKPPAAMEGRPMYFGRAGGSFTDRINWMVDTNTAAQFRDRLIASVTVWFVVLQIILTLAALVAFVKLGKRSLIAIELAALALIGFLAAMWFAGLIPFYNLGVAPYWLFLFGVGIVIALIAWFTTSHTDDGVMTLIVPLSILVGLILVDVATGSRLQFNTVFGYTPTVSGRYAGLGNLAYAAFSSAALLLAGLLAEKIGGRKGALVAIALLGVAIVIDGAPFFGSDVGGVLSMVSAYAVTATLLMGWRIRLKLIALYAAATVLMVALFAAIDLSRPIDKRTHLGRLVASGSGQGGFHTVSSMIQRKLQQSNAVYSSSIWSIMFPLVLAGIAYLIYRAPGRMKGLHQRLPKLSAALAGLGVLIVLGTLLNDSGIAIAGVMLGVVTPVLIVVTVRGDRVIPARPALVPEPEAVPDPAPGAVFAAERGGGVIVALGLVVGLLTVRLFVIGGRDVLVAPVLQRENFRGRVLPTAAGLFVVVAALVIEAGRDTLGAFGLGDEPGRNIARPLVLFACLGFGLLGLVDDLIGTPGDRGFRGHLRALRQGRVTTGSIKIFGGAAVALVLASNVSFVTGRRLLSDAVLIALAANLANLLDRAPGRTIKYGLLAWIPIAFVAGGDAVGIAIAPVIGAFCGLLGDDLREHVMLGDTGANVLGAVLGLAVVLDVGRGPRNIVLIVLILLTIAAEVISFSDVIERVPILRRFDDLGRLHE